MAELSEKGRKLIDVAMVHDEPPATDDSWGALVSRLTAEVPRETLPLSASSPRSTRSATAIAIALVLTILAVWAWSPATTEPREAVERGPASAPQLEPIGPAKIRSAPPQPPADQLLVDAEAALGAGDPARAMALLLRHAEIAATDASAPQRMALRVLVLCAQNQREQAHDEATAFLSAHPESQWSERVRRSCAGDGR